MKIITILFAFILFLYADDNDTNNLNLNNNIPVIDSNISNTDINITFANKNNFKVDDSIIDAIKNNECFIEDGKCNPFIIRLNDVNDINKCNDNNITVNKNLIKCESISDCSNYVLKLENIGIINFDSGAYQINHKYNKLDNYEEYFDDDKARFHVNRILMNFISKWGYSWQTIGRYHHSPESDYNRNRVYYEKLSKYIDKVRTLI